MTAWSDREIRLLTRLARELKSADVIAKALDRQFGRGLSRSAVIGKAHRLGVRLKPPPPKQERPAKVVQQRKRRPTQPLPPAPSRPGQGYEFLAVPPLGCLFEIGGASLVKDFRFCGEPRMENSSWCPRHNGMVTPATSGVKRNLTLK